MMIPLHSSELKLLSYLLALTNTIFVFSNFQSNRSQPAIGMKQTPKARVSVHFFEYRSLFIIAMQSPL